VSHECEHKNNSKNQATAMVETQKNELVSLGEFRLTAYCSCYKCCDEYALNRPVDENGNEIVYGSIGEELIEGYSIAVDPSVIPYGAEVVIDGKTYKAQDCGAMIDGKEIDIYFSDHESAKEFEVQYKNVYLKG
jgi:3D (Asp-Asp-Asp) domain-containing protein